MLPPGSTMADVVDDSIADSMFRPFWNAIFDRGALVPVAMMFLIVIFLINNWTQVKKRQMLDLQDTLSTQQREVEQFLRAKQAHYGRRNAEATRKKKKKKKKKRKSKSFESPTQI